LKQFKAILKDWDSDKGKGSGINYEYDCIKSFAETFDFQELSAKYGLDPQIMVDFFRAFASHINVPKGNGDVYHEPFKYTCIESDIVIDDCNKHAQISESTTSYKHVNFSRGHNSDTSNLMSTTSLYCDDKITLNQHDELTLFFGYEELSRKTSLVDMSAFKDISILQGCRL
jgi:hypothetical protein